MTRPVGKAAYVLRQGQTRNHTCHWPDCGSGSTPELSCEIAVDGQVVDTRSATTGVTFSTRPW